MNELGRTGEAVAAKYYQRQGWLLLDHNYRTRFGEIDLIVKNRRYLVFVEVKLRKNSAFAQAREFVDYRKQQRLRTTASMYLSRYPTSLQPRFDVIEIYAPQGTETKKLIINHLEDAFE